MAQKLYRFFRELKERKVYRVATVYTITGWIIVEVTDTIFPHLGLPEWTVTLIVIMVLIGFPIALILSWIYDVGPHGLVKTSFEDSEKNPLPAAKKKPFTSSLTIGILIVLLIGQFVYFGLIRKGGWGKVPDAVRTEKVAVAPFSNFTGNESLDAFGLMASDWITSGLRELKVQTSSPEMMRRHSENVGILPGNPENEVSLFELTGARYVITGSYYVKGDQMEVSCRLESTETGDVIYNFPAVSGPLDQKEELVDEVRDRIKGYWAVKEAEDLSRYSPPKYESYRVLMECGGFYAIDCYWNALSLDSTFMLARVYMYYSSLLWDMDSLHEATGRYIREHLDKCTEFERNYFDFVDHIKQQRYEAAALDLDKNVQLDPKDLLAINESAHIWLAVNRPDVALERFKPIFDQFDIFRSSLDEHNYLNYFDALIRLGKSNEVVKLNNRLEQDDYLRMGWDGRKLLVRSLMKEGEWEKLDALMDLFRKNNIFDHYQFARNYNMVFPGDTGNYFGSGLRQILNDFKDPEDSWGYITSTSFNLNNYRSKAQIHYVLKEYEQTLSILKKLKSVDWENYISDPGVRSNTWYIELWVEGLTGASYARLGIREEALAQVEFLESMRNGEPDNLNRMFFGEVPYYQARIYAILDEPELALQALQQSMNEGRISEWESFVNDPDLVGLRDYQPYLDLFRLK